MPDNVVIPEIDPEDLLTEAILAVMPGDYAYIGAGQYSAAEIELAFASQIALQAEIDENLMQAGELAEKPQKVESKTTQLKTRNYLIAGKRETTIEVTLAGLGVKQKDFYESADFSGTEHTMVCVNRAMDSAVIFNGLRWTAEWSGESDGLFSMVLSAVVSHDSGQVVMLSELPEIWPGDIEDGALFLDSYSKNNAYDAEEEKYSVLANLAHYDTRAGLTLIGTTTKSENNAFLVPNGNYSASFDSDIFAKHLIMVVSPDNTDLGDMVLLYNGDYAYVALRADGDQLQISDAEGIVISGTIGEAIGVKSLIEIKTETQPFMMVNNQKLEATKGAGFGDVDLSIFGGPEGETYSGEVYAIFVAQRELTDSKRAAVVTWMKKRYGITGW